LIRVLSNPFHDRPVQSIRCIGRLFFKPLLWFCTRLIILVHLRKIFSLLVEGEEMAALPWPPLVSGVLIKRYKRFLADVTLESGLVVTAHCPNSGRMTGCSEPGRTVYLSRHDTPNRKLKYTWEMIQMPDSLVGVNTLVPNRLVAHSLRNKGISTFEKYGDVHTEVKINSHTRLDIMLSQPSGRPCYLEIKNCTLVEDNVAMFPDAPTERGRKHLQELARLRQAGARTVIFFLIQRCDAKVFAPAGSIDPEYARCLMEVVHEGVEIMAYDVRMDLKHIVLRHRLPCRI
jgi:sugar fermentation stimulation protein A